MEQGGAPPPLPPTLPPRAPRPTSREVDDDVEDARGDAVVVTAVLLPALISPNPLIGPRRASTAGSYMLLLAGFPLGDAR